MSDTIKIPAKTVLFREGNDANDLVIIKSGRVVCLKASTDRLIPVYLATEEDIVGESAMLDSAPYTYSAITLTDVELIKIPNSNFGQALKVAPQWLVDLTLTMISRFQSTAGLVAENRLVHPLILSEEEFTPSLEIEFKRLLAQ